MKLSNTQTARGESNKSKNNAATRPKREPKKDNDNLFEGSDLEKLDDDEDEEYYDETRTGVRGSKSKLPIILIFGLLIVFVIVTVVFLNIFVFSGSSNKVVDEKPYEENIPQDNITTDNNLGVGDTSQAVSPYTDNSDNLGIQDFSQDTNMSTTPKLSDVREDMQDIFGLSVRVDYDVEEITSITDFVNYTKKRGTFGNGLEFYWLKAVYRDTPYIIQVPFTYYKELDESGIVPVKAEVLKIREVGSTELRTIVSYMKLDSETLQEVLKNKQ